MTRRSDEPRCKLPLMVDPERNMKPDSYVDGWDSWFITANVEAGGDEFGLLLHCVRTLGTDNECKALSTVTLANLSTLKYAMAETSSGGIKATDGGFAVETDILGWSGGLREMKGHAKINEDSSVDLILKPHGNILPYNSTGLIPMFGGQFPNYQYALPSIEIKGMLKLDGVKYEITNGNAWFDRQWAPLPTSARWLWMSINLSDGDIIGLWETDMGERYAWATVLHPDGSVTVAEMASVIDSASGFWKGDKTGIGYASEWKLVIPALQARLDVVAKPPFIDIVTIPRLEQVIHVSGQYRGKDVSGRGYVEEIDTSRFRNFTE